MRTAAYNSVFPPTYAINATNVMMVHPTAAAVGGTSDMKATPSPLPKRVAVVSKYYIRRDIAGSRGGSLGWLVINIEVGAPMFT